MTPDEVVKTVNMIANIDGIPLVMTRTTLLRFETQELISKPDRGGSGRGAGRWTDYPDETVFEVYAAWCLMHGYYGDEEFRKIFDKAPKITPITISKIRAAFIRNCEYEQEEIERHERTEEGIREYEKWWEGLSEEERGRMIEEQEAQRLTEGEIQELYKDEEETGLKKQMERMKKDAENVINKKLRSEKELDAVRAIKKGFLIMYQGLFNRASVLFYGW